MRSRAPSAATASATTIDIIAPGVVCVGLGGGGKASARSYTVPSMRTKGSASEVCQFCGERRIRLFKVSRILFEDGESKGKSVSVHRKLNARRMRACGARGVPGVLPVEGVWRSKQRGRGR